MKTILSSWKSFFTGRGIMVLMLFCLLGKMLLLGYLLNKGDRFFSTSLLTPAVAQEELVKGKEENTGDELLGQQELKTLSLLEEKRKALEKKEEEMAQKDERLQQLKAEIEEKLVKLSQMEKNIERLIALKEGEEDKELVKLAKVFEATPPEQAGPVFNKLDDDIAAKVLVRMKGRNAGKIWGYVDPDKAVSISKELAKLK